MGGRRGLWFRCFWVLRCGLESPAKTRMSDIPHLPLLPTVTSMGSSASRLYSALAKTLPSSAGSQPPASVVELESELPEPLEPQELLAECRAVLQSRPPRCRRDFVAAPASRPSRHPPIRVMQWNILAQGRPGTAARGKVGGTGRLPGEQPDRDGASIPFVPPPSTA